MARSNKYTTINFNDIFEKKSNPNHNKSSSSSSSSSTSSSSSHRSHGGMLVLTRPSPKPKPKPQTPKPLLQSLPSDHHLLPRSEPESIPNPNPTLTDTISLRPLGRTGTGSGFSSSCSSSLTPSLTSPQERPSPSPATSAASVVSLKPEPFVPPHLRPGFVGKEEKFEQNVQRNQGVRSREIGYGQVQYGSQSGYNENGRPKSGGGYERMRRGGAESDPRDLNRPSSSGNRQSSGGGGGGWYGNSYNRSPNQF